MVLFCFPEIGEIIVLDLLNARTAIFQRVQNKSKIYVDVLES